MVSTNSAVALQQLMFKIGQMRKAQIEYFKNHSKQVLGESKKLEREVDKMLQQLENIGFKPAPMEPEAEQSKLFIK